MKSGLSLTPVPSDANKVGSKVTRHEEPGRAGEAASAGVPQQTLCSAFSAITCQIMTLNTHLGPQIVRLPAAAAAAVAAEGDLKSNEKIAPLNHF